MYSVCFSPVAERGSLESVHSLKRGAVEGVFRTEPQKAIKGPGEEGKSKLSGLQKGLCVTRIVGRTGRESAYWSLSTTDGSRDSALLQEQGGLDQETVSSLASRSWLSSTGSLGERHVDQVWHF